MRCLVSGMTAGVLAAVMGLPAAAVDTDTFTLSILDFDRQGFGGRHAIRENNQSTGDPRWQLVDGVPNGVTPFNSDTWVIGHSAHWDSHRGGQNRIEVRRHPTLGRQDYIGFFRLDLLPGLGQAGTVTSATVFTPQVLRPGSNTVDGLPVGVDVTISVYGLLPGIAGQDWVETIEMNVQPQFVQTPPWPITWNNAPAVNTAALDGINPAQTWGNGALLGQIVVPAGMGPGTRLTFSGGEASNLTAFLNDARLLGDEKATFIFVAETVVDTHVWFQGKEGGADAFKFGMEVNALKPKWSHNGNGEWTNANNWIGKVPNFFSWQANFTDAITQPVTVNVSEDQEIGHISFDNANSYTIGGPGRLWIGSDSPQHNSFIKVHEGHHTIDAPVTLRRRPQIFIEAGASLRLNDLTLFSTGTDKFGGGTLEVNRIHIAGRHLFIGEGVVRILPDSPENHMRGIIIDPGAQLDLTNNDLVISTFLSPPFNPNVPQTIEENLETVSSLIRSGYNGGTWDGDGIVSSTAVGDGKALGYQPVEDGGDSYVEIMYTFPGDANLSGTVTIADLSLLASNWQLGVDDGNTAHWFEGDFTYDGRVTIADLSLLASNWQAGVSEPSGVTFAEAMAMFDVFNGVVIPEPAMSGLLGVGGLLLLRRRSRGAVRVAR